MKKEYCGQLIRHLINNHRKGRLVPRLELADLLELNKEGFNEILEYTSRYLQRLGIEMVGIADSKICAISACQKIFLRKTYDEAPKGDCRVAVSLDEKRLFMLFCLIQLENDNLEEQKLSQIKECKYFKNFSLDEFLKKCKTNGYLNIKKANDMSYWCLGWRYYAEFDESFNVVEYFSEEH